MNPRRQNVHTPEIVFHKGHGVFRIPGTHLTDTRTKAGDRQNDYIANLAMYGLMAEVLICDVFIAGLDIEIGRIIKVAENGICPGSWPGEFHDGSVHLADP